MYMLCIVILKYITILNLYQKCFHKYIALLMIVSVLKIVSIYIGSYFIRCYREPYNRASMTMYARITLSQGVVDGETNVTQRHDRRRRGCS